MKLRRRAAAVAAAGLILGVFGPARAGTTPACGWSMASRSNAGKASRSTFDWPALDGIVSGNGRFILFSTDARNLVGNDDDRYSDVLLRDLATGTIRIVGRGVKGRDPKGDAWAMAISHDGRYVLFSTGATNVHPAANGHEQIYRRDLRTGRVDMVSRSTRGAPANMSTGGRAGITPDGRYVVFISPATNLLGGGGSRNDSNFKLYLRDIEKRRTILASILPDGGRVGGVGHSISRDGRLIAFVAGRMTGPAEVYVRNLETGRTVRISKNYDGSTNPQSRSARNAVITPNGRYVMFTHDSRKIVRNDSNRASDVFVYDRRTKRVERVSVGTGGKQADGDSQGLSISDDGSVVTFVSTARNIDRRVTFENNGFAHDRSSRRTRLFTICDDGTATAGYHNPDDIMISGNKRTIVTATQARNWAPEANDGRYQVYHRAFDIRPPTVLTTSGPYATTAGIPVDLSGTVRRPTGDARSGVTIVFKVTSLDGTVVWRSSATTDASGTATVTYIPAVEPGRYLVTAIVPATSTYARAEMADGLRISG